MEFWNSSIKFIRDSFKLEEIKTTFRDGTKKTIWKVACPMPEMMETVDFVCLLSMKLTHLSTAFELKYMSRVLTYLHLFI